MTLGPWSEGGQWLEAIVREREERAYRELFERIGDDCYPLSADSFRDFGAHLVDPRWLTCRVLESMPTPRRPAWLYVTSGLSNPWDDWPAPSGDPNRYSGLGIELVVQTPERAVWAISLLHALSAVQLLTSYRKLPGDPFGYGDRVALGRPLDPTRPCELSSLFITAPSDHPASFALASGRVDLLLCVGITDEEQNFGTEQGSDALLARLLGGGAYPTTDSGRRSVRLG